MSVPPMYLDTQRWLDDSSADPLYATRNNGPQPNQTGWLLGNTIAGEAPPASWAGLTSRPHVEEFVPPNPPQAMGVSDGRMLVWPTSAPRDVAGRPRVEGVDDRSSLMQLPYFRQRVLEHDQEAVKERLREPVRRLPPYDSGIVHNVENGNGRCAESTGTPQALTPYHFDGPKSLAPSFSRPCQSARKNIAGTRQQRSMQKPRIHVQKEHSSQISVAYYRYPLPEALTCYLPRLTRPSNPSQLQFTLKAMKPTIVYTRYSCGSGCRSRGICVHFSFVLGGRSAPDGLVCDQCLVEGREKAADADRDCARHVNGRVYLAEDLLATDAQAERARELLRRAVACEWEGVPESMGREDGVNLTTTGNQWSHVLPIRPFNGQGSSWSSVTASPTDRRPCAKKARLSDHCAVSSSDNRWNKQDNQDGFAQYLVDPSDGLIFDNVPSPDFRVFMAKPNGGFGNAGVGC